MITMIEITRPLAAGCLSFAEEGLAPSRDVDRPGLCFSPHTAQIIILSYAVMKGPTSVALMHEPSDPTAQRVPKRIEKRIGTDRAEIFWADYKH